MHLCSHHPLERRPFDRPAIGVQDHCNSAHQVLVNFFVRLSRKNREDGF
jgi:hypothetical protein